MAAALMIQGTGSHVGKSLLVAALARAFTNAGVRVRPFKPQNMSNNAAVTADGGEIGRAQAVQALACRTEATRDMNPVLLKAQGEMTAQLVVQGRLIGSASARDFQARKGALLSCVLASFARLGRACDLVLVEGAGSAAEVNLRAGDIANMGFAASAGVPVVLAVDIDRGGAPAAIVGTVQLLDAGDKKLLCGYIINKFRGDAALLAPALDVVFAHTGLPCLGVVPWLEEARLLPQEDSVALDGAGADGAGADGAPLRVAVPRLPHIANFDDFDPLAQEPGVRLFFVAPGEAVPVCDAVIVPGSKAVLSDMAFLRAQGWDVDLAAHRRRGGWILGLCGGYQMLGRSIADPCGMEGSRSRVEGLGFLDVATELASAKTLALRRMRHRGTGCVVEGYEMHLGVTRGRACDSPSLVALGGDAADTGARDADGRVEGFYMHGAFASDSFRRAWLGRMGAFASSSGYGERVEAALESLALRVARCLDLDRLLALARSACGRRGLAA